MAVYLDQAISGQGTATLTGFLFLYASVLVTAVDGHVARPPASAFTTELVGFGYIQFGFNETVHAVTDNFWRQKLWIHEQKCIFALSPGSQGPSTLFNITVNRVRWNIYGTSTAWLNVQGT